MMQKMGALNELTMALVLEAISGMLSKLSMADRRSLECAVLLKAGEFCGDFSSLQIQPGGAGSRRGLRLCAR